jgi:hypothetical protein
MARPFRLRVSAALAEAFEKGLEKDGYGPRQKGRWIGEALKQLQKDDPRLERVGVGDERDAPRVRSLGVSLPREHFQLLEDLVLRIRESAPLIEGVRALVIRSAIRHRVRHSSKTS